MTRTRGYEVDLSINTSKEGVSRQELYTSYYNCRHLSPLHNVITYKVNEHDDHHELNLKLYILGESEEYVHLLTESKSNEFFTTDRLQAVVQGITIHSVKPLFSGKAYVHNKDNIDVNFVVDAEKEFRFEVELEEEIESTEGNETSTIRIDINKETLAHGLFTTFSDDYDIGDEVDPESCNIDVEEIVPYLISHRHQFSDMTAEYNESYENRRLSGELV